jgi:hypothetical protein
MLTGACRSFEDSLHAPATARVERADGRALQLMARFCVLIPCRCRGERSAMQPSGARAGRNRGGDVSGARRCRALRLLMRLAGGEAGVSELAEEEDVNITTVSARLKTLHAVRLVKRARGQARLLHACRRARAALGPERHRSCGRGPRRGVRGLWARRGQELMTTCCATQHPDHTHQHGPGCGHPAVRHSGRLDYLHDGHLHHPHGDHCDDHGPLASL